VNALPPGKENWREGGTGMRRVQIVTDSTSDLPAALASELGIIVIPCQVSIGRHTYLEGIDLSPEEFYARLAGSTEQLLTSQPPVGRFVDTYRQLLEAEPETQIISIHVASSLSGTVNAAWAATQMMPDPLRLTVIDSGQLSMGLGWAAVQAARLARTGATASQVDQAVRALLPQLRTAAMIDTLENLYKGGRISQISATLGAALQIKPLLSVYVGQVLVEGKVRTYARALSRLVDMVRGWAPLAELAVMHTGVEEKAHELAALLDGLVPAQQVVVGPAGPALTAHLGLGALGVCILTQEQVAVTTTM
jgi:DegV family protein with EDD domain